MKDRVKPFMSDISQSYFILLPKIKVDEVEKNHLKLQKLNRRLTKQIMIEVPDDIANQLQLQPANISQEMIIP